MWRVSEASFRSEDISSSSLVPWLLLLEGGVIDGYFCAVREKGYRYGASDAGEAAGDCEDLVGEERWEGRHADQEVDVHM